MRRILSCAALTTLCVLLVGAPSASGEPMRTQRMIVAVSADTAAAEEPAVPPTPEQRRLLDRLVFGSLAVATVLVIGRAVWARRVQHMRFALGYRMGPVNWSFTDSWASTLTILGAVLGTILGADLLPAETTNLPSDSYPGLNLFFGVLVALAPLVFNATRRPEKVANPVGDDGIQYQGVVWAFLLGTTFTLSGAFGEIATVYLLLAELEEPGAITTATLGVFSVVMTVGALALIAYGWRGIGWTLRYQVVEPAESNKAAEEARREARTRGQSVQDVAAQPMPTWSVL